MSNRRIVATMPAKIMEIERFEDGTPKRVLVAPFGQEWAAIWVWPDQVRGTPQPAPEIVKTEVRL